LLVWRNIAPENPGMYFTWSPDQGKTWSETAPIPYVLARIWHQTPFDIYDMAADRTGNIHLLAVGHKDKKGAKTKPPQLLHLEWDGSAWQEPKIIYQGILYPEYPRIAVFSGQELHVTFFTREQLWKNHDEVKHKIWYVYGNRSGKKSDTIGTGAQTPGKR